MTNNYSETESGEAQDWQVDQLAVSRYEEPYNLGGRPRSKRGWTEDKKRAGYEVPENLVERFNAFISDDDYLSLKPEIALLRSLLNQLLAVVKAYQAAVDEAIASGTPLKEIPKPPISPTQVFAAIDNVGKMVERQNRIVNSDANTVTVESAVVFAIAVADVVNRYVKDPKVLEAVFGAIRHLLTSGRGFKMSLEVTKRLLDPTPMQMPADEPLDD